ncbi:MAG: sigma-54-dependent Fis family transcriptional regulator, partial [Variovorax sp.]
MTSSPNPSPGAAHILVVDDEPDLRTLYELTLLREGYRVESASSVAEARQQLGERRFDAVITDMRLPDGLGLELLHDLQAARRPERCVVMTAYGSAENAVEALRAGAFDYLTKPVDLRQFRTVVASAVHDAATRPVRIVAPSVPSMPAAPAAPPAVIALPGSDSPAGRSLDRMVGESQAMRNVKARIAKVARSMAPVLVRGESGTG